MSKLNQTQKEFLETITNVEDWKAVKKALEKANNEIIGLTEDQIYCLNSTVYTDSARKKLIKIFIEENLRNNLAQSVN